ncbi:P-loop containing nucleoside triphosphate hydrolase protein, partial [Terfezia claveryi]
MSFETNFRTNLVELRRLFARLPCIFLTATLPPQLLTRFREFYSLPPGCHVIRQITNRPNLEYFVIEASGTKPFDALKNILSKQLSFVGTGKTVIYCRSKKQVDDISKNLKILRYHSEVPLEERQQSLVSFTRTQKEVLDSNPNNRVIAATGALGAGIDPPDIRLVIHFGGTWSAIDFGQESGRAGRDGELAKSIILLL